MEKITIGKAEIITYEIVTCLGWIPSTAYKKSHDLADKTEQNVNHGEKIANRLDVVVAYQSQWGW